MSGTLIFISCEKYVCVPSKSKINAELVEQEAGELLQEQDNFIDFVQNSDKAIAYLEHIENQELRKTVSEYEVAKQRNEKILSESWLEFNSSTSTYFEQYRRKKKMLFEEIKRARQDSYYSRKRLKSILYDIAHNNDFFIVKMFKLVVALFIAVESQSLENEVKKLQKKNQEIKLQAKQIMSDSQSVGEQLRSGGVDMIEQVLNEYENQLQKSIEKINEINTDKVKLPDNYTEQER